MQQTIATCLQRAKELQNSDSARLDTELLLAHSLDVSRTYLFTWPEKKVPNKNCSRFNALFERRLQGEPIAYLLGRQDFWSLSLCVSPSTLIPRPETELLVETALDYCSAESRVLDLGTGTGAIALALAAENSNMAVEAVDRVADAVALAHLNAKLNQLTNVKIYQSSWFENVQPSFDLIVSNPPYIEADDTHLHEGDVRFEPASALVAGADGLDDIRAIVAQAPAYLFEGGALMLEHGWNQGDAVRQLFLKAGFNAVNTVQDLAQRDRITLGFVSE